MTHSVIYGRDAQRDLRDLYDFIAGESGHARARSFTTRIRLYCDGLATFPSRGTRRDDLGAGVRLLGFDRCLTILFLVTDRRVDVLRVLYGGREVGNVLDAS